MPRINVAQQNLVTWSEDQTNAAWQKANLGGSGNPVTTLQAVGTSGPFPNTTATKVDMPALAGAGNYNLILNAAWGKAAQVTYRGAFMKGAVGGEVIGFFSGNSNTGQQFTLTNQWAYYEFKQTDAAANYNFEIGNDRRVAGTVDTPAQSFYISCIQISQGDQRAQYVKTTSSIINNGVRRIVPKFQNLITNSEALGSWSLVRSSVTSDSVVAPDGTMTADTLLDTVALDTHFAQSSAYNKGDGIYTFSQHFKQKDLQWACLRFYTQGGGASYSVNVDLTTGIVTSTNTSGTITNNSYKVTSLASGWYRVSITMSCTGNNGAFVATSNSATPSYGSGMPSYAGTGTQGVYTWGGQLVQANWEGLYTKTTASVVDTGNFRNIVNSTANYALNSENGVTGHTVFAIQPVTNNATTAPDGNVTAYKITEDSSLGRHFNFQTVTGVPIGGQVCASVYLKAAERRYANIRIDIDGTIYDGVTFDLQTGVVTSTSQSVAKPQFSYGIANAGNGWWRCWVSNLHISTSSVNLVIGPSNSATPTYTTAVPDYQGDGVSGIYAWGEQFNRGWNPANYIKTTSTQITAGATAPRRLVPKVQNLLTYSEDTTNGAYGKLNIIPSISGTLVADGATMNINVLTESSDGAPAAHYFNQTETNTVLGSNVCFSLYAKAGSRNFLTLALNTANDTVTFNLSNGTVDNVGGSNLLSQSIISKGSGWYKLSMVCNYKSTLARVYIRDVGGTVNYQGNGSIATYITGLQLVQANWAGPYTPTTSTTVNTGPIRSIV